MPRLGKPAAEGELCPLANEQQRAKGNDGLKLFLSFDYAGLVRKYRQLTPQNEFLSDIFPGFEPTGIRPRIDQSATGLRSRDGYIGFANRLYGSQPSSPSGRTPTNRC